LDPPKRRMSICLKAELIKDTLKSKKNPSDDYYNQNIRLMIWKRKK